MLIVLKNGDAIVTPLNIIFDELRDGGNSTPILRYALVDANKRYYAEKFVLASHVKRIEP